MNHLPLRNFYNSEKAFYLIDYYDRHWRSPSTDLSGVHVSCCYGSVCHAADSGKGQRRFRALRSRAIALCFSCFSSSHEQFENASSAGFVIGHECAADSETERRVLQAAHLAGKEFVWREKDSGGRAVLNHVQLDYRSDATDAEAAQVMTS